MKRCHLRHHFISKKHWLGVSTPAIDMACGTYAEPRAVQKSATMRDLHLHG